MTPTPELIDLARRFHELGGTKYYLFNRHDFAIKPDGEVDCITSCDGKNAYFRVYEDYPVFQLVRILTTDELWAWLWRQDMQIRRNHDEFYLAKYEEAMCMKCKLQEEKK